MARNEPMTTRSADAPAHARAPTVVGFALRALAWLPIAFAVWYFAAPLLLFPVALLLRGVAWLGFADLVRGIEQSAAIATFVTALRPGDIAPRGVLTVDVNLLLYAFGMPLFAAQTGFSAWQREAIAFAFQFGSLILPAVAPAVLWVAMHGRFIAALRHRERTGAR